MKKLNLKVKGMHCKSCSMLIQDSLTENEGVKNVEASHEKGIVNVEFDEKKIKEDKIKAIIKNEGYEVI